MALEFNEEIIFRKPVRFDHPIDAQGDVEVDKNFGQLPSSFKYRGQELQTIIDTSIDNQRDYREIVMQFSQASTDPPYFPSGWSNDVRFNNHGEILYLEDISFYYNGVGSYLISGLNLDLGTCVIFIDKGRSVSSANIKVYGAGADVVVETTLYEGTPADNILDYAILTVRRYQ